MDNPMEEWSVRDLAELAGTTVRTIHYYISEGLLPPAAGATRNATYSPAHLARLRLIAALREEGLALANIRQRLAPLTDRQAIEVARELETYLRQPGDASLTTLGLIEAVLASKTRTDLVSDDTGLPHSSAAIEPIESHTLADIDSEPEPGTASEYLKQVLSRRTASNHPPPLPRQQPPPRKPVDVDRPEAWYHLRIAEGVELRVREDRYRESRGRLRSVVETVRSALQRYGLSDPKDWS